MVGGGREGGVLLSLKIIHYTTSSKFNIENNLELESYNFIFCPLFGIINVLIGSDIFNYSLCTSPAIVANSHSAKALN